MQCWHISYGGVGVFTGRNISFDSLSVRHSVVQRSRRRMSECSRGWLSFQRLRRKVVVSWQPWLCSFAGTLDQVRVTSSSWRLTRIFGCGLVSMYLDLEIWRLWNTFCRSLVDIPGDHQVPMFVRTLQSTLLFSFCNGLVCHYAHSVMFCPVLIADFRISCDFPVVLNDVVT